ncbi:SDR family oxidoreductase [Oceanibacterium hippocampi]|uniref:C-factor n=1 Tax=Oceanibacterium hippocampi TaxID=745714 RepID=A0A1Y5SCT2_9PROT|nr:SDR family oxidoreductase [Oceanibacterium hippocampi]SLN37086.1 C-factor [Oceanibacterium hippocampi]
MPDMKSVLVTGAARGLGLEFCRRYLADGWRVHAACRTPEKATTLMALAAGSPGELHLHRLDVTSARDGAALAGALGESSLDLLINNAGIIGPARPGGEIPDEAAWSEAFRVNCQAPYRLTRLLADALGRAENGLVVFLSSTMGSIGNLAATNAVPYRTSKVALNMAARSLSIEFRDRFGVLIVHPGYVRTDMGGPGATIEAEESVAGLRRLIDGFEPARHGGFFDYQGKALPW